MKHIKLRPQWIDSTVTWTEQEAGLVISKIGK